MPKPTPIQIPLLTPQQAAEDIKNAPPLTPEQEAEVNKLLKELSKSPGFFAISFKK